MWKAIVVIGFLGGCADVESIGSLEHALTAEVIVNQTTAGPQIAPAIAWDFANERFVVGWESCDGTCNGAEQRDVFTRPVDVTGQPLDNEARLNRLTAGWQDQVAVSTGQVAAWRSATEGIFARRASDGRETLLSAGTDPAMNPDIATGATGTLVVWRRQGAVWSIRGRLVGAGEPGPEMVISRSEGFDDLPAVTSPAGRFVVAWQRRIGLDTVMVRPLDYRKEVEVDTFPDTHKNNPDVAGDATGSFVVAYERSGASAGIWTRGFDRNGTPLPAPNDVPRQVAAQGSMASIAMMLDGRAIVAWHSGGGGDVYARRLDADGTPIGPEFLVNTQTFDIQYGPQVAFDPAGNFCIVWTSEHEDLNGNVYVRCFPWVAGAE